MVITNQRTNRGHIRKTIKAVNRIGGVVLLVQLQLLPEAVFYVTYSNTSSFKLIEIRSTLLSSSKKRKTIKTSLIYFHHKDLTF